MDTGNTYCEDYDVICVEVSMDHVGNVLNYLELECLQNDDEY